MAQTREFTGLLPPRDTRKQSDYLNAPVQFPIYIRDQLSISTWLCLGGIVQGGLFLAAGRLALLLPVAVVVYRVLLAYAKATGWLHDEMMDGVIGQKFSAVVPDEYGDYGTKPANNDMVVLLIGAKCNSQAGMFAHGFKDLGDFFVSMAKDLEVNAEKYGYLGMTRWINSGDRMTNSEIMSVAYFRSVEGLHQFAHDGAHRAGWDWWNKDYKQMPHISIWHEIYHAPKGNWESIYVNSHPTGINSTTYKYFDKEAGKEMWASPVVDASKGLLKTSAGRMSRSQASEHEKMGVVDPY